VEFDEIIKKYAGRDLLLINKKKTKELPKRWCDFEVRFDEQS
jgi:hypothetical protein